MFSLLTFFLYSSLSLSSSCCHSYIFHFLFYCFYVFFIPLFLSPSSFSSSWRHNAIFHFLLAFLCFLFTFFSLHIVIFSLVLSLLVVSPPCNFFHFRFSSVLFLVFPRHTAISYISFLVFSFLIVSPHSDGAG